MPLRDVAAYTNWLTTKPNPQDRHTVHSFLVKLGTEPWTWPSIPVYDLSNQPVDEARAATLELSESRVWIYYRHFYATGDVDLVAVIDLP